MAQDFEAIIVFGRDDGDSGVLVNGVGGIDDVITDFASEGCLSEARAYGFSNLVDGDGMIEGFLIAVWQGNDGHGVVPFQW
jgi:hypothetical protein